MKLAWQALDRRLDKQYALNLQLFRDGRMDKLRRGLRPLVWGQAIQMLLGLLLVGVAVAFWATHWHVMHLLICGLLVLLYGVLLTAFAARNLYLIHRIDHAAPVLQIQRQLADLRAWRVRVEAPVNAILGCFVWIPVVWMNLAWYGIDLWSRTFFYWSISSSLVGVVIVVLVVWLMRRAGMARRIEDNAAGRSIQKATATLDEISRFEQE
ncbi:hypothetical protein ACFPPA_12440 [Rhodanobacter ginsengisoli]|uniref:Serine/threonine protein kinase n=2 Tax=Rhodanobacter ginsengisoli TaxID=418646 RepID=A0ABW0QP28_9GAMM